MSSRSAHIDGTPSQLQQPQPSSSAPRSYKLYRSRWILLAVVCLLNISSSTIWLTFAASADTTVLYFGISALQMNILTTVELIVVSPVGFVAAWVIDTYGLRASLLIGAWANGIGALLRNFSTFSAIPDDARYPILLIGQILAGCAAPFVGFVPTKMAALWFPENRRTTANMLGTMSNMFGNLVAFMVVPLMVAGPDDMPTMLWALTGPALAIAVITSLCVQRSVPPTPPSPCAAVTSEPFLKGLRQLSRNKNFWLCMLTFGVALAFFTAITAFLPQILCPRGYTDDFSGLCGALMIAVGIVASLLLGLYVDRTKRFVEVTKICLSLHTLAGIAFTQVARLRDMHVAAVIVLSLFGGFGLAIMPVSLELIVEVTYPVAVATSTGLVVISGQLQGIAIMFVMQALTTPLPEHERALGTGCQEGDNSTAGYIPQDWTVPNLYVFNCTMAVVSILFVFGFQGKYKRLEAEQKATQLSKSATDSVPSLSQISTITCSTYL